MRPPRNAATWLLALYLAGCGGSAPKQTSLRTAVILLGRPVAESSGIGFDDSKSGLTARGIDTPREVTIKYNDRELFAGHSHLTFTDSRDGRLTFASVAPLNKGANFKKCQDVLTELIEKYDLDPDERGHPWLAKLAEKVPTVPEREKCSYRTYENVELTLEISPAGSGLWYVTVEFALLGN